MPVLYDICSAYPHGTCCAHFTALNFLSDRLNAKELNLLIWEILLIKTSFSFLLELRSVFFLISTDYFYMREVDA